MVFFTERTTSGVSKEIIQYIIYFHHFSGNQIINGEYVNAVNIVIAHLLGSPRNCPIGTDAWI